MASIQLSRYEAEEGDLPDVCMCCGAPATERKRRRFISHPLWVYLFLPFGYIPYVIVAAILTENVRCYTLFCPRHRNHWLLRSLVVWGAFVVLIVLLGGSFVLVGSISDQFDKSTQDYLFGSLCIATPVLLFCWLISIPIMQLTAIHPGDVMERRLTLKRVSPEFVEAVHEHRAQRRAEEEQEDHLREFRHGHSQQIRGGPEERKGRAHPEQPQDGAFHPGDSP